MKTIIGDAIGFGAIIATGAALWFVTPANAQYYDTQRRDEYVREMDNMGRDLQVQQWRQQDQLTRMRERMEDQMNYDRRRY